MQTVQKVAQTIRDEVAKVIIGQGETLDLLLVGLFAGGHVLLEDVPGVGKTVLSKALAASLGCRFTRIQCTPDLLPSDILGTTVYNPKSGDFQFREGPIFSQIVLTDEINRAIPRTQSALLEAMGEGQVTIDGTRRPLQSPFFVIATQNPIEYHGTFPLPEAQLDRFMLKISLGYPSQDEARGILRLSRERVKNEAVSSVVQPEEVLEAQREISKIHISEEVEDYLLSIVAKTRNHESIVLGVSPRGMIALGTAAQALAAIKGRAYVIPDDIKYLVPRVLGHRIILDPAVKLKRKGPADILAEVLAACAVPVEDDAVPAVR